MTAIHGFPPIGRADARILILGSMPSRESLARQQYYAHPRNAFWPILSALLDLGELPYRQRALAVAARGVAVWDVLESCQRPGSLDAAIDDDSIVTNDFPGFFRRHRAIRRVYFNGAKAETVYRRRVLPDLPAAAAALPLQRLPSTSPAHAALSLERKISAWRAILEPLEDAL